MIAVIFTLVGAVATVAVVSAWLPFHDDRVRADALRRPPKNVAVMDFRPFVVAMGKLAKVFNESIDPALTRAGQQAADEAEDHANRGGNP
jgi:hypothetical protein